MGKEYTIEGVEVFILLSFPLNCRAKVNYGLLRDV
jgi:hypothetical protein